MGVYLIHFHTHYKHAGHYLGWSSNVEARLEEHRKGQGARLMTVIYQHNIGWECVREWEGDRELERRLKRWHSGAKLCPICKGRR
jgi:predicted GIY-YIG superfamily endonuclease